MGTKDRDRKRLKEERAREKIREWKRESKRQCQPKKDGFLLADRLKVENTRRNEE